MSAWQIAGVAVLAIIATPVFLYQCSRAIATGVLRAKKHFAEKQSTETK